MCVTSSGETSPKISSDFQGYDSDGDGELNFREIQSCIGILALPVMACLTI